MTETPFPSILSAIVIGQLTLRNRIVVPAHTTNYGENHLPTDRHVAYHEARARGGVGLIIFESIRVHPSTLGKPQGIAGFDRRCIEPFAAVAEAVHRHGARIFGQVISLGRQVDGDAERVPSWGPSPVRWSLRAHPAHVMDRYDIAEIVEGHVTTALNVLEAGLDGLEIHLGHGHLLQQFLSPASNTRQDDYGGSEENRMRLALEVLEAVRNAVGPDAPMGIRISADEYLPGGLGLSDMKRIVPAILDRVPIDFVHVSHSAYHDSASLATQMADMTHTPDPYRRLAREMTETLRATGHNQPTIAVCMIRSLEEADGIVARGDADMVGMARAHIADPDLVNKATSEKATVIRPCIGCNQGCAGFLEKGLPITCLTNPTAGREGVWTPEPVDDAASEPRSVLVVGGGPGGMEAAWVAAARGHKVTLWEAGNDLGGRFALNAQLPLRQRSIDVLDFQRSMIETHGVEVVTGRIATVPSVLDTNPSAVVIATGANPRPVRLEDGTTAMTVDDAVKANGLGESVAVIDLTGEWSAAAVVEHLARSGHAVSWVTPEPVFAWNITSYSSAGLFDRLRTLNVHLYSGRIPVGYSDGHLEIEEVSSGKRESIGAKSLIGDDYGVSADDLVGPLRASGRTVRSVGDALAPRTALEAVFEGHTVAREL